MLPEPSSRTSFPKNNLDTITPQGIDPSKNATKETTTQITTFCKLIFVLSSQIDVDWRARKVKRRAQFVLEEALVVRRHDVGAIAKNLERWRLDATLGNVFHAKNCFARCDSVARLANVGEPFV